VKVIPFVKFEPWIQAEGLSKIEDWARKGLNDTQIAQNMGVTRRTLYNWGKLHPEMVKALNRGRAPAIAQVENALFKSACGYTTTVQKAVKVRKQVNRDVEEHVEYVQEEIHVPANVVAQIFYLKNMKPEKWRDHPEVPADKSDDPVRELLKRWNDAAGTGTEEAGTAVKEADASGQSEADGVLAQLQSSLEHQDGSDAQREDVHGLLSDTEEAAGC